MILVLTYVVAALVLGGYIAWFLYRYRRDKRNEAAAAERTEQQFRTVMPPVERTNPPTPSSTTPSPAAPSTPSAPSTPAAPSSGGGPGARTVAEALSGIEMPHDLVPLTTIPHRAGAVDQVAFSSKAPVSVVGPLFADELERLGYALTPLDETSMAAKRGNDNLMVYIHSEPVSTAPEGSVVIEVCVPY